jgi:hypothetical protein
LSCTNPILLEKAIVHLQLIDNPVDEGLPLGLWLPQHFVVKSTSPSDLR